MAYGQTVFSTAPSPALSPSLRPYLVRIGDDWPLVGTIKDTALASVVGLGGTGFITVPTLVVAPPSASWGKTALVHAVLTSGSLSYIIDDPGSGYDLVNPPLITVIGGGGTGAVPVAAVGNPVNLTGSTVTAELGVAYQDQPVQLTGANGSCTVLDAINGVVSVNVAPALTSTVPPQSINATTFPTCLSIVRVDSASRRHTFDPLPLLPLTWRDYAAVAIQPGAFTLLSERQGPAGAGQTINGHTGAVITLTAADVGAATPAQVAAAIAAASAASFTTAAALALALG